MAKIYLYDNMPYKFNEELIRAIEARIPKKRDQIQFLMDSIVIGKETAYRRLRKEIPFTFDEACLIAQKMGISLDNLTNINQEKKHMFELAISPEDPLDYILTTLEEHEKSYELFLKLQNLKIESVFSTIAYSHLLPFENLFRFSIFKLIYQLANRTATPSFASFHLPKDIDIRRQRMAKKGDRMPKDFIILGRNIFRTLWGEICYFHSLDIISNNEKDVLRDEFINLITYFEYMASEGRRSDGVETWIYLANIELTHSYTYIKAVNFERAYMDGIYLMDTIFSDDPVICQMHKKWIDSIKRLSTFISISGDKERRSYFDGEKKMVLVD